MISIETALHAARNYHRANPDNVSRVCEECRSDATVLLIDGYGCALCRACKFPKQSIPEQGRRMKRSK